MSTIPATQELKVEDFPEQKGWIGKLFYVMNRFIRSTVQAINGGIEFEKNITGVQKDLEFEYISNAVTFPVGFQWSLNLRPAALSVVLATKDKAPVALVAAWEYTAEGLVQITDLSECTAGAIAALTANSRYLVRVRVTP